MDRQGVARSGRADDEPSRTTFSRRSVSPDGATTAVRLTVAGVRVDRMDPADVLSTLRRQVECPERLPLAIGSVNLDHIHHFGTGGRYRGLIHRPGSPLEWLMLVDGAPVARHAQETIGAPWPRITGADLLPDLLTVAAQIGARVGFLGGWPHSVPNLRVALDRGWPELVVAGQWTPSRSTIQDRGASFALAAEIKRARVDILVVGLGKPHQEMWVERYGVATEAKALTAFGAAADFLAGSAKRAPEWMRQAGVEWAYRLAREPRRLSRRYLFEGPVALWRLHSEPVALGYRTSMASQLSVTRPNGVRSAASEAITPVVTTPSRPVPEP